MNFCFLRIAIFVLGISIAAWSQNRIPADVRSGADGKPQTETLAGSGYILGPNDQLTIAVQDVDEISDPVRVDMRGDITLPLIGRIHAAGSTTDDLQTQIADRLKKFVKDPDVVVSVSEFGSEPVSVLGAVGIPGVHQVAGHKTLFEVLSLAGGLRADAGNTIRVTRDMKWGPVPLPDAKTDASGQFSVASVSVKTILNATDPVKNIAVMPDDIISVSKADIVYAVGSVVKPGGFPMNQDQTLSTLQVLSLAEGFDKTAAPDKAKILRAIPGSSDRTQIAVNLKLLMAGKAPDVALRADDILFVPTSGARAASQRAVDAIVTAATGVAIYGRY